MTEQMNILVVDDNEDLLETFSMILRRRGFSVETAPDGVCAVDKYKAHHFDVTLMDIVMPEMNGVEALRRIREINPEATVILMTAYSEDELMRSALAEGARCIVHKPVRIDRMIEMIKEAALGPLILIVDDDDDICQTMTKAFELAGYQVLAAGSGEEAVRIAKERGCQIAFVDVKLPIMNGLETYLKLKQINPGITAAMMTGYGDEVKSTVGKAIAASAVTCLYKPFDPMKAIDLVSRLSEKSLCTRSSSDRQREHISR